MSAQARMFLFDHGSDLDLQIGRGEAIRRINRAMDYIEANLAEPIKLKEVAAQAHFSPYHFVRVFTTVTGETPVQHLRRLRLMRAAVLLYAWPKVSVLEIALTTGFHSAAAFARAFHQEFGMNASTWRRGDFARPGKRSWCWRQEPCQGCDTQKLSTVDSIYRIPPASRSGDILRPTSLGEIKVKLLPPRRIAYMRGIGPFATSSMAVWRRFMRWLTVRDLHGLNFVLFAQLLDSPYITAPRYYRYDAGLVVDHTFVPDRYVNTREVPAGWFVTATLTSRLVEEGMAVDYLRRIWLPAHGYTASGSMHYICMPRPDNITLTNVPFLVSNITLYLPVLPPRQQFDGARPREIC